MPSEANQKQAFRFLQEHFRSQEPFTKQALQKETKWRKSSIDTYWTKQFKPFVTAVPPILSGRAARKQRFRVSDAFRPYAKWEKFRQHVTQVRRFSSDYKYHPFNNVLIYGFFMPLTNEGVLRTTLDALFYKDTITTRLKALDTKKLNRHFPRRPGESDNEYFGRVSKWISGKFVGYSINHVSGRFGGEKLATMEEATKLQERGGRYLIDETTAITRFIFPCGNDANRVRWFFNALFVESIIQLVNGEEEIWMVESGMVNQLHIWRVEN